MLPTCLCSSFKLSNLPSSHKCCRDDDTSVCAAFGDNLGPTPPPSCLPLSFSPQTPGERHMASAQPWGSWEPLPPTSSWGRQAARKYKKTCGTVHVAVSSAHSVASPVIAINVSLWSAMPGFPPDPGSYHVSACARAVLTADLGRLETAQSSTGALRLGSWA